jgi:Fe-S cluster biogenesis protein NfuA
LTADPVIAHLLIAHAIHPDSLLDRVERALEEIRPYLHSHGGEIELLGIEGDHARLRLQGSCNGCASSAETLRGRVESAVRKAAPELLGILVDGTDKPTGLVQLRSVAQKKDRSEPDAHRCELCSRAVNELHRHLLDLEERRMLCACPACATLFDRRQSGGRHYRLIPDRHHRLPSGVIDDAIWAQLQIPVDVAFFFHNSIAGRTVALYPGPAGATESTLALDAWDELRSRDPVIGTLEPDVEALLVCRTRDSDQQWIVPVDRCYQLTGLMRSNWRGLGGGPELWERISEFFQQLERDHG